MVIANVLNTYTTVAGMWQYDYGQILRIQNLKLPHAVEIHFSLQEKGGESVTRVGTTRDNVTDVVIPDSMLENGDTTADYKIYAFIYLTDSQSGQTEYKISMSVKSRPRPEQFEKQEDGELFRKAISEVNKSADSALQSKKEAEAWAHGHVEYAERDKDNARYYAKQAKDEAQKIPDKVVDGKNVIDQYVEEQKSSLKTDFEDILAEGRKSATSAEESATKAKTAKDESVAAAKEAKQSVEDANTSAQASKESASTASSASDTANSAKEIAVSAANSADSNALAASKSAQEAKQSAEQADTAAKSANESKQAIEQLKTAIDTTAEQIATDRTAVEADKKEVKKAKSDVENLKEAIEQKSSEAITEINTARNNAVNDVNTAKDTAVNTVNDAKDNVVAEINKNENVQQIKENKDDIAEAQTDIEELKDKKITKFYANNLGETHLEDSDSGKIQDMFLYGKSEQKQYTGKNLSNGVNNSLWIDSGATTCGIGDTDSGLFIDVSELSYVTVSTRNVQERYRVGNINTLPTKEVPNVNCYNGTQMDGLNRSYTLDTTGYKYLVVNATNLEDIQVEIGTEATAYEPYTGGIPSPNPDYPQEIRSVVNPVVKIYGNNLLDAKMINRTINGIEFVPRADGTLAINGTARASVTYTIVNNFALKAGTYSIKGCKAYYIEKNGKRGWFGTDKNTFTVKTFDSDVKLNVLVFIPTGTTVSEILKPMLAKGDIEREYEQYKEQVVNLPYTLNAIPVKNGGNITIDGQQYIADYVDVERGKLVRNVREVDFSTCIKEKDYYNILDNSKEIRYSYNNLKIKQQPKGAIYNNGGGFINAFTLITSTTWNKDQIGIFSHAQGSNNMLSIRIPVDREANEYFDEIGGCKGLFEIDTTEEINLTQEEIEAFKELATYYPVTNISVTSDQLDGYTTFNYPVSMKNGWDYVKQQLGDTRDYIYDVDKKAQDIDTQSAEAYVNSEYAVALTELEVM